MRLSNSATRRPVRAKSTTPGALVVAVRVVLLALCGDGAHWDALDLAQGALSHLQA